MSHRDAFRSAWVSNVSLISRVVICQWLFCSGVHSNEFSGFQSILDNRLWDFKKVLSAASPTVLNLGIKLMYFIFQPAFLRVFHLCYSFFHPLLCNTLNCPICNFDEIICNLLLLKPSRRISNVLSETTNSNIWTMENISSFDRFVLFGGAGALDRTVGGALMMNSLRMLVNTQLP